MNAPSATTLAGILHARAAAGPDRVALRFEADTLTYRELDEQVARLAAGLSRLGVRRGDPVCVFFETSLDSVATWLALTRLGAIEVPVNTGFRGEALTRALRLTGARLLLLDASLAPIASGPLTRAPAIRTVVLRGDARAARDLVGVRVEAFDELADASDDPPSVVDSAAGDTAMLLFTSGSTGPSKACEIPHHYVLRHARIFCSQLGIGADDVLYAPFPLFHVDAAVFTVAAALSVGGAAALAPRFSAARFWADCRRHGATVFDFMGATLTLLYDRPRSTADPDNPVRLCWGVPAPPWAAEFERRFDLELVEVYGLTDAGIVLYNEPGSRRRSGSCGRAVSPFEVRVHGDNGADLPDGQVGELVVRAAEPHLVTSGYRGDPAATAAAFRDGWLRTGDLVRRDADGYFYFVTRTKDVIRRRGENISAYDLEQVLLGHPAVLDAAVYGVPSPLTEEDVMVTVQPRLGTTVTADDIWRWAGQRLAPHMVPRYVRIAAALPRTETEKVAKHVLRDLGVTEDTADREAQGRAT